MGGFGLHCVGAFVFPLSALMLLGQSLGSLTFQVLEKTNWMRRAGLVSIQVQLQSNSIHNRKLKKMHKTNTKLGIKAQSKIVGSHN